MKKKILKQFGVMVTLALSLGIVSCAQTSVVPAVAADSATSHIQVLYSQPNNREYEELGLVTAQTGQTILHDRSINGMIERLKVEALKMGADAIIVRSANAGTWGLKGGGNTGFDRGHAQAVAIKFK